MSKIYIKMMTDRAYEHLKRNLGVIANKIKDNDDNSWVLDEFIDYPFVEKKYEIEDFVLKENKESLDKKLDFQNSVTLYNALKNLPTFVITNEKFWLWLYFEKFYKVTKSMMEIKGVSTVRDHWMFGQGIRRGLMFGVLSRCFFRVSLTIDESRKDKFELTKWIVELPERYRNLTWRVYSSEKHLVRGIISGEKKAVEKIGFENTSFYPSIAKYVSRIGSVKFLDVIEEKDIETLVYDKMIEYYNTINK